MCQCQQFGVLFSTASFHDNGFLMISFTYIPQL
jgi:hypothetical protein